MGVNAKVTKIVRVNKVVVTRKGFAAWLNSQPDNSIVGISNRPGSCPVAQYVRDKLGVKAVAVGFSGMDASDIDADHVLHMYQQTWTTRSWLYKYVMAVDLYDVGSTRISAEVARELLAKV